MTDDKYERFLIKRKTIVGTPYKDMTFLDRVKLVSISIANWRASVRVDDMTRRKLAKVIPDRLVLLLDKYDAWELYANRRRGTAEKVRILMENYEREYGKVKI